MKKYLLFTVLSFCVSLHAAHQQNKIYTLNTKDGIPTGWQVHYELLPNNKIKYTILQTHNTSNGTVPDDFSITVIDNLLNQDPKKFVISAVQSIARPTAF